MFSLIDKLALLARKTVEQVFFPARFPRHVLFTRVCGEFPLDKFYLLVCTIVYSIN